jgi:hypothetical protein
VNADESDQVLHQLMLDLEEPFDLSKKPSPLYRVWVEHTKPSLRRECEQRAQKAQKTIPQHDPAATTLDNSAFNILFHEPSPPSYTAMDLARPGHPRLRAMVFSQVL